jgi:hypothetical protein
VTARAPPPTVRKTPRINIIKIARRALIKGSFLCDPRTTRSRTRCSSRSSSSGLSCGRSSRSR